MSRTTDKAKPFRFLPGMAVLAFGVAAASQANKQIVDRSTILRMGEESGRFIQTHIDEPRRGMVVSADGQAIAEDLATSALGLRFDRVPNVSAFFVELSEATGISASEFEALANHPDVKFREWQTPLTAEQTKKVQRIKSAWRADGLSIRHSGLRQYPLAESAAGIVGFLRDGVPQSGVEKSLNDFLKGKPGKTVGIVDRRGSFLPMRTDRESEARIDGQKVVLTIDSELQMEAAKAVRTAVEKNNADSGVAIVIDPKTGDLLAMANWPSFDPMNPVSTGEEPITIGVNPSYMSAWEPGSTFKILTLAKALDMGVVSPGGTVACSGTLKVWSNRSIRCDAHGGSRAHGTIDNTMAIAKSCNVSAALWAGKIGYTSMVDYLDALGLLKKSELGLPLERSGEFNRNEYAKGLQLATVGFGQSLNTTPVALAGAFALVANGGVRMEPRLIKSIGDKQRPSRETGQVLSPEACDLVLSAMRATIQSDAGTGHKLRIPGYTLGGKTGTAQKINKKSGTVEGGGYVSNFVGYVPGDDPKAVVLVMIDNPRKAYYGATVAGPVFVDVAKAVIRRLGIPKEGQVNARVPVDVPAKKSDAKEPVEAKESTPSVAPSAIKGPNIQVNARKIPSADSPPPKPKNSETQGGR